MTPDKQEFEHESLQDKEQVVAYLRSVADGIEAGLLKLSDSSQAVELSPHGLLRFAVRAQVKRSRVSLQLRCSWKQREDKPDDDSGPLKIESKS